MADVDQLARDVVRARDPVAALGRVIPLLSPVEAVHVVDSVFWRLPAYCDEDVLMSAAEAYRVTGALDAALLLDGLALQMRRAEPAAPVDERADARAVLAAVDPQARLRDALVAEVASPENAADLLLRVWRRLPVVTDYWVVYHAAKAFEDAGRLPGAMVLAGYALQLVPNRSRSDRPAATLLRGLLRRGRYAAARSVAAAWLRPDEGWAQHPPWPEHLARAAPISPLPSPKRLGCGAVELVPADTRPALAGLPDGGACPPCLAELKRPQAREPIALYRLLDADVFLNGDDVAVFGSDGTPYPELSVGRPPVLVRTAAAASPVIGRNRAVLVSDLFPVPNLCHFLCDQMPKLALYRRSGSRLDAATVIGARLRYPFQTDIAARFGAGEWLPTDVATRVRVAELSVVSTCAENQHPAHLGAPWAMAAIRAAFGLPASEATASGIGHRRLYVSRSDARSRRVVNEAELLSVLLPAGFEVVVPGSLAIADQAALFAQASHVVGAHGAGMTNIAFCSPGARVLELFHRHYGTYAFAILAQAGRLDYRPLMADDASLDGTSSPDAKDGIDWIGRDMRIDVAAVSQWLAIPRRHHAASGPDASR